MNCDSVNYMIGLNRPTHNPFRVQRSTNLLAAQHVRTKMVLLNFQ